MCSFFLICFYSYSAKAKIGTVWSYQKISDTQGNFTGTIDSSDNFGCSVTSVGDLDSDSVTDIVIGAYKDNDGGSDRGAVWVLFLNTNGTVKSHQKISDTEGDFTGTLDNYDYFGGSVASLGDLDSDGVTDIAVGAYRDDDGGTDKGAVWVLFLDPNGTVKSYQKISDTDGNFAGTLGTYDYFGSSVTSLVDLDDDGVTDIAVGNYLDDDGSSDRGAVWILFLNTDGTVKAYQKISDTQGNFTGVLNNSDHFGYSVASVGDLDGDGNTDIVVGATEDDDGGSDRGAVWVLFLNTKGTVNSYQKISDTEGNFTGTLSNQDYFGSSIASLDDFDGDAITDIVVGTNDDDDGGSDRGAVWVLFLDTDGTVLSHQKISDTEGNFTGTLDNSDYFGSSVTSLGDLDDDSVTDIAVGAIGDDDGGGATGAVWVLFLYACRYELKGDVNNDCKVDLFDFAWMCDNWLIDCNSNPNDPSCIPK